MHYLQVLPNSTLPEITNLCPFRAIVIIEEDVTVNWQTKVSEWLVSSGCLYMMAWGKNCSSWDDSVDYANLEEFDYGEIPKDKFVLTTWHENESLKEVFHFSKYSAFHLIVEIKNTLLLHISKTNNELAFLADYDNV